jgi:hypothetical protein
LKSEVKKKMMFDEHATHTPKSLKRSSSRNFSEGILFIVSTSEKFSREVSAATRTRRFQTPPWLKKTIYLQAGAWLDRIHPFLAWDIYNW